MNEIITEEKYPISILWVVKSNLNYILGVIVFSIFFIFLSNQKSIIMGINQYLAILVLIVSVPIKITISFLKIKTFHYSIEDDFLILKQGIISKEQRSIPYNVIQNIFITQSLFDRFFGFKVLIIENASNNTINNKNTEKFIIGYSGNKVNIPGLKNNNAELLKEILLKKMEENKVISNKSGL